MKRRRLYILLSSPILLLGLLIGRSLYWEPPLEWPQELEGKKSLGRWTAGPRSAPHQIVIYEKEGSLLKAWQTQPDEGEVAECDLTEVEAEIGRRFICQKGTERLTYIIWPEGGLEIRDASGPILRGARFLTEEERQQRVKAERAERAARPRLKNKAAKTAVPRSGQTVVLYFKSDRVVPLGVSQTAFKEYLKYARAGDKYGEGELLISGRIFYVRAGDTALVLDTDISVFSGSYVEVRVMSGAEAGRRGWTFLDMVH